MKKRLLALITTLFTILLVTGIIVFTNDDIDTSKDVKNKILSVVVEQKEVSQTGSMGDTQKIAVLWKNDISKLSNVRLVYKNPDNKEKIINEADRTDDSILFEKDFSKEDIGNYSLLGVSYFIEGEKEEQFFEFNKMLIDAEFKVVEEVNIVETKTDEIVSVKSENENYVAETVNKLMATASVPKLSSENNKEIVVTLDPGHSGNDPGACYYGMEERYLNWDISMACKEELEDYGVKVVVVRTKNGSAADPSADAATELEKRAQIAADNNSNLLVSIHNNATGYGTAQGFMIFYPYNCSYQYNCYSVGYGAAQKVEAELKALGLYDNGLKIRKDDGSSDNDPSWYDSAKTMYRDYYGIIRRCRLKGVPAILIEHAFMDNSHDAALLKNPEFLKKMGIADATGIASYFGLSKGETIEENTYTVTNKSNNKVLSIPDNNLNNGIQCVITDDAKTSNQHIEITREKGGYTLTFEHSGKVVDVNGGSYSPGAKVQQYTSNSSKAQKWFFFDAGDGYYYIKSSLQTYLTADANGNIFTAELDETNDLQKWRLDASYTGDYVPIVSNGVYTISSALGNNMVMDVNAALTSNSANVQIYSSNKTLAQKFNIEYQSNGLYKITAAHSDKALDINGASKSNNTNVQQYAWNGTNAQLWKLLDFGNGKYCLKSRLGTVATVSTSKATNGSNVCASLYTGIDSQLWTLTNEGNAIPDNSEKIITSGYGNQMQLTVTNEVAGLEIYKSSDSQRFVFNRLADGYYRIIDKATNKVLQESDAKIVESNLDDNNTSQKWRLLNIGNNKYAIKSYSGRFVYQNGDNADGTEVQLHSFVNEKTIQWVIEDDPHYIVNPLVDGIYSFVSGVSATKGMDVSGASKLSGANVQLYDLNGTNAQMFQVKYNDNGYYSVINVNSEKSLYVASASKTDGANLCQYTVNGNKAQKWRFLDAGDGYYYIVSALGTVVDVKSAAKKNETNIWMYSLNKTNAQKWKPVTKDEIDSILKPVDDGVYTFVSALGNNRVMDISGASTANQANVQLYQGNGTLAQQFNVTYSGSGYYTIKNLKSAKSLDVKGGSSSSGANVWQYTPNGTDAQRWKFIDAGDGYYYIESSLGTVVDVSGANSANGTNIWMYAGNGTNAQKWKLVKSESLYHAISGTSSTNKDQLIRYFNTYATYPSYYSNTDAPTLDVFCQMYIDEATEEGIRAEVAFAQAMKETGWLRFGGQVKIEQKNFAGLGATDGGAAGAKFNTVREGIRAQIQHLKAYANTESLKNTCVDPRFDLVKPRGCAPYVEWLGQKENPDGKGWATAANYGYDIVSMVNTLLSK